MNTKYHWKESRHNTTLIFEKTSHPILPFSMLQTSTNPNVTQEEATKVVVGMEKLDPKGQEVANKMK
jgi:hypothetical protein